MLNSKIRVRTSQCARALEVRSVLEAIQAIRRSCSGDAVRRCLFAFMVLITPRIAFADKEVDVGDFSYENAVGVWEAVPGNSVGFYRLEVRSRDSAVLVVALPGADAMVFSSRRMAISHRGKVEFDFYHDPRNLEISFEGIGSADRLRGVMWGRLRFGVSGQEGHTWSDVRFFRGRPSYVEEIRRLATKARRAGERQK